MEIKIRIIITPQIERPMKQLEFKIEPIQRIVSPGEQARIAISLFNPEKAKLNLTLILQLLNPETNALVLEKQFSIIFKNQLSQVESLDIPQNLAEKEYTLVAKAIFEQAGKKLTLEASSILIIEKSFLHKKLLYLEAWNYLALLCITGFIYFIYLYINHKKLKSDILLSFVNLSKIPRRKTSSTLNLGRIARTTRPALISLDTLKGHLLITGSQGSGKSIAAQDIVEEALAKNIAVIVFDPTFQWTGFLKPNQDKDMLSFYPKFSMRKSKARGFISRITLLKDPAEVIDFKQAASPGQLTIFCLAHPDSADLSTLMASTLHQLLNADLESSSSTKLLIVYDDAHKVLPRFSSTEKGLLLLERAVKDFKSKGISIILISQLLKDIVETIHTDMGTKLIMATNNSADLDYINTKYGKVFSLLNSLPAGTGILQNSEYNEGRPYFISFRPTLHDKHSLPSKELQDHFRFSNLIDNLEYYIQQLTSLHQDTSSISIELKLIAGRLKQNNLDGVEISLQNLLTKIDYLFTRLNKAPKPLVLKKIDKLALYKALMSIKHSREALIEKEEQVRKAVGLLLAKGYTLTQVRADFFKAYSADETIEKILKEFQKDPVEQLKDYIQRAVSEGFTPAAIKSELVKAGWTKSQIAAVFKNINQPG